MVVFFGRLQNECFGTLNKENGHWHIAKRGLVFGPSQWFYTRGRKNKCFKIAMQELNNKAVLVLLWVNANI